MAGFLLVPRFGITGAGLSVLIGVAAGALIRRLTLRMHFEVKTSLLYSAGPVAAAALATAVAFAAQALLGPGAAVAAGLIVYAAGVKLWLVTSGESLALKNFEAGGP
jgi:O-antigen/teichoic acid export membrane protein